MITNAEELVREWANFHPDIPLTKGYKNLVECITTYANHRYAEGLRDAAQIVDDAREGRP